MFSWWFTHNPFSIIGPVDASKSDPDFEQRCAVRARRKLADEKSASSMLT